MRPLEALSGREKTLMFGLGAGFAQRSSFCGIWENLISSSAYPSCRIVFFCVACQNPNAMPQYTGPRKSEACVPLHKRSIYREMRPSLLR